MLVVLVILVVVVVLTVVVELVVVVVSGVALYFIYSIGISSSVLSTVDTATSFYKNASKVFCVRFCKVKQQSIHRYMVFCPLELVP